MLEHAVSENLRPQPSSALATNLSVFYRQNMKNHAQANKIIEEAVMERRCAYSHNEAENAALRRRMKCGELVRAAHGLYLPQDYWNNLSPPERTLHIARSMSLLYPHWIFAGLTSATIHGFDHPWSLHSTHQLTIVGRERGKIRARHPTKRIYVPNCVPVRIGGFLATNPARTLIDCSSALYFRCALSIFDSAFAHGVTANDVLEECEKDPCAHPAVAKLLLYANPDSDNGGESFARGTMIVEGFMPPMVQVPFIVNGKSYRVDFLWKLADERIIVGEFDGTAKYVDPDMTDRRSIQGTVFLEREREDALRQAGVTDIVRFTFDDVLQKAPLIRKLKQAGVPMASHDLHNDYAQFTG